MYKHNKEKKFYNYVKNNLCSTYNEKRFIENSLKVTEFNYCYNKKWAKKCYKSLLNEKYHFKIHYYKELEYTVPYAIQAHCILFFDFNDKRNNNYSFVKEYYECGLKHLVHEIEKEVSKSVIEKLESLKYEEKKVLDFIRNEVKKHIKEATGRDPVTYIHFYKL
jgi:hypothetical protein